MTQRQSRQGSSRTLRISAILTMVVLPAASIALDTRDGRIGWSMIGSTGTVIVLALHAYLSHRHPRRAPRLLHGQTGTTTAVDVPVLGRAAG